MTKSPLFSPAPRPGRLILTLALCAGWAAASLSAAPPVESVDKRQVIGEVTARGQAAQKKRQVLSKVKARKGDVIVDPSFRADTDRLLETGLYDDVQVELEEMAGELSAQGLPKVRVIFVVKERPLIKRVDFKGNLKLKASKFQDEIGSKSGEPYDRFKVGSDVDKILSVYREEGYVNAQVETYTTTNPSTQKVILTFFITEGNRVLVNVVNVDGNTVFSDKKIRKTMKKTRRKKVFKDENLSEDMRDVERLYKNEGYLEVLVSTPTLSFNEGHTLVDVSFQIEEGRRYRVGDFSFDGATIYTDKQLRKAVVMKKDALYRQDKFDESMQNLHDLYADKGYLRAEIVPIKTTTPQDGNRGSVDFRFEITESSVVYVDRIYVDGNTYTKEEVIRREVLLKEGDVFSAGRLRRSVEKIYNLGFLDDVQVDVQQPRSATRADIVLSVVEGKPGVLSAGAGFSSVDGLLGTLQVQHMNLFGRAQRLNLMWEFGKRKQNYEIGWTDPWFMDKRMSFGIDLRNLVRVLPAGSEREAYKESRKGFSLRLGPRISDQLSLFHTYTYEQVRRYDIKEEFLLSTDTNKRITPADQLTSSLTNGLTFDNSDNYFDPSRGTRDTISLQWAGRPLGGNVNFYKPQVSSAFYFPTFWKFVFTASARSGFIKPFSPSRIEDLPSSERFYMGGVNTVRGYDFGEIGPILGGLYMMVYNVEYKFPIVQERNRTILQGAFFADTGGAWMDSSQMSFKIGNGENHMKSGAGFGIRFKTPVFPIRLDWGYGFNHRDGESLQRFDFTIGNLF